MGTPSSTPPNSLPECILVSQGNKPLQGLLGKCFWGGAHDAFCLWCFWGAPVPKPPSEVWQHIPLELLLCFSHLCCRWSQGIFQVPSLPDHATILTPIFFFQAALSPFPAFSNEDSSVPRQDTRAGFHFGADKGEEETRIMKMVFVPAGINRNFLNQIGTCSR